jgi:hypothetical protein
VGGAETETGKDGGIGPYADGLGGIETVPWFVSPLVLEIKRRLTVLELKNGLTNERTHDHLVRYMNSAKKTAKIRNMYADRTGGIFIIGPLPPGP